MLRMTESSKCKNIFLYCAALIHLALWQYDYSIFGARESSANLWVTIFFVIALAFPTVKTAQVFCIWLLGIFTINLLEYFKLKYLNRHLSEYDFSIIASSPKYAFESVFGYGELPEISLFLSLLLLLFLMIKFRKFNVRRISEIFCACLLFSVSYFSYQKFLEQAPRSNLDGLGEIAYSGSTAIFRDAKSLLKKDRKDQVVSKKEIDEAAKKYLISTKDEMVPNIVFVLAESTFDPNKVFKLRAKYLDNSLFYAEKNERFGELQVAITGGGTWVTEFETISGISTKVLGFHNHMNSAIAPHLQTSFTRYLKNKNYRSYAFLPTIGAFVDRRKAFEKYYGFDEVNDVKDLGFDHSKDWQNFDTKMMDSLLKKLPSNHQNQFFAYVTLLENHGPHRCQNKETQAYLDENNFAINCQFDQYLSVAKSTETAIKNLREYLQKIEQKTKRPFLIVIFGDHQPWDFNDLSFDAYRIKGSSRYTTIYKMIASDEKMLRKIPAKIPDNMLPSLASRLVTKNSDDLYLPENFYLFEKCGVIENVDKCLSTLDGKRFDYHQYWHF